MITSISHQTIQRVLASAIIAPVFCLSGFIFAAESSNPATLLANLEAAINQLRQIDVDGEKLKNDRQSNRREMDQLESRGAALLREKEDIDNRVAQYQEEASVFNAECSNISQAQATALNCPSRQAGLATLAAALDEDAADIAPDFEEYNREVDTYNASDAEMAEEEEILYEMSLAIINQIDANKSRFLAYAVADGNQAFIADVEKCNSLRGYEDTLFCLRRVWELVQ